MSCKVYMQIRAKTSHSGEGPCNLLSTGSTLIVGGGQCVDILRDRPRMPCEISPAETDGSEIKEQEPSSSTAQFLDVDDMSEPAVEVFGVRD